jgi:serine/threonine protein kinase
MDFGLAKPELSIASHAVGPLTPSTPTMNLASLTSAASPLTQKGSIVGTFQYMAPELLQGAEADARSDLFSFGCVLYEMITGRRAFEGKSQTECIHRDSGERSGSDHGQPAARSGDARSRGAGVPGERSGGPVSIRARHRDGLADVPGQ